MGTDRIRSLATPLTVLALLCALSLAARAAWLGEPCHVPCRSARDHVLVFDERYYVNAARVIAGVRPPTGSPYASSPRGDDPNAEHPQLAKLIVGGSIELFGDGPLAWRIGSLVVGTLAIVGMFVLARACGARAWVAVGAAALMALDNLLLVHGRIATLDIYVVTAMIWGAALYLRGRPLLSGAVIGAGTAVKLVAPYTLLALGVYEGLRWLRERLALRASVRRLVICAVASAGVFLALLAAMDRVAPPYDTATGKPVSGGLFGHIGYMLRFGANQRSPQGPRGIASYPWQWLGDYKPITYLNIEPKRPSPELRHIHPAVHFLGLISPPILLLAIPALVMAAISVARGRPPATSELPLFGLAWVIGTLVPFELLSLIWSRTTYLYYMVIVMPGIYLLVADLVARAWPRRRLVAAWIAAMIAAAIVLYPFTPLP